MNLLMHKKVKLQPPVGQKKAIGWEVFIFLGLFLAAFIALAIEMGPVNMFNTMMYTAFDLLTETVFYIMAIAVLAGAISALFSEFGVISLLNLLLSPFVKFLYGLPGASAVGIFTTYLSDNPAILTLASDNTFRRYFKRYQLPALCNIGTAFGMGLIVTTFMAGIESPTGENLVVAALIGNLGAIVGSIVSTRIMLLWTAKIFGKEADCEIEGETEDIDINKFRKVRKGSVGTRFLDAMLSGGKTGVEMGMAIIPGVLIICTVVMMLTNNNDAGVAGVYEGLKYEGIGLLPWIGSKLNFIVQPLFGFQTAEGIAVPITALGAAGAAITVAKDLVLSSKANAHDVAVFTAMCMCWSGYLSTHVAMMDSLKCSYLVGPAIISHTIGGLCAGIFTNWFYKLLMLLIALI